MWIQFPLNPLKVISARGSGAEAVGAGETTRASCLSLLLWDQKQKSGHTFPVLEDRALFAFPSCCMMLWGSMRFWALGRDGQLLLC